MAAPSLREVEATYRAAKAEYYAQRNSQTRKRFDRAKQELVAARNKVRKEYPANRPGVTASMRSEARVRDDG